MGVNRMMLAAELNRLANHFPRERLSAATIDAWVNTLEEEFIQPEQLQAVTFMLRRCKKMPSLGEIVEAVENQIRKTLPALPAETFPAAPRDHPAVLEAKAKLKELMASKPRAKRDYMADRRRLLLERGEVDVLASRAETEMWKHPHSPLTDEELRRYNLLRDQVALTRQQGEQGELL